MKVWASEMLDMVVDEVLQIFAGYGYVEEYPAERAYRMPASTESSKYNEINRLNHHGLADEVRNVRQSGSDAAIKKLMDEVMSGTSEKVEREGRWPRSRTAGQCEKLTLFVPEPPRKVHGADAGPAGGHGSYRRYDHRGLSRWRSAILRAEKIAAGQGSGPSTIPWRWRALCRQANVCHLSSRTQGGLQGYRGDMLRTQSPILRRLSNMETATQ